jgi:hypothetical protein
LFLVLSERQIINDRLTRKDASLNFRHALGITGLHNMRAIIGRCFFDTRFARGRQIRRQKTTIHDNSYYVNRAKSTPELEAALFAPGCCVLACKSLPWK